MTVSIIGVDPGGTTGVALLQMRPGPHGRLRYCCPTALQIKGTGAGSEDVIERMSAEFETLFADAHRPGNHVFFAVEAFMVGHRAGRSSTPQAGRLARKLIGQVHTLAYSLDARVWERSASQVKLWAIDARLRAAGGAAAYLPSEEQQDGLLPSVYDATKLPGGHARDAARHALFAAVAGLRWPDPLSRAYSA